MTKEIVTLQVGTYSNFVGAHFLNQQASSFIYDKSLIKDTEPKINHDVLFREGADSKSKFHYTPRVIIIDDQSKIGYNRVLGSLYSKFDDNETTNSSLHDSTTHLVDQTEGVPKNPFLEDIEQSISSSGRIKSKPFYDLDPFVKTWTDYLNVPLHQKSLLKCRDFSFDESIGLYETGIELGRSIKFFDEFESRFRFYVEECDSPQGFHLLSDMSNSFGGLTSVILEYIREECKATPIVCFSFVDQNCPKINTEKQKFTTNSATFLSDISSSVDLFLPLSTNLNLFDNFSSRKWPYLVYKNQLPYHTSSILASAIDCITSPWRILDHSFDLSQAKHFLTAENSRKLIQTGLALPNFSDSIKSQHDLISLFPNVVDFKISQSDLVVMRGMMKKDLTERNQPNLDYSRETNLKSTFDYNRTFVLPNGLSTKVPFPNIFDECIAKDGSMCLQRPPQTTVEQIASMTSLQAAPECKAYVEAISCEFKKLRDRKFHGFDSEVMDRVENSFDHLIESYR